MPLLAALTVGGMMVRLAKSLPGCYVFDGTATAGAAGSITDTAIPANTDDSQLILGAWVGTLGGTGSNQERTAIAPYTATSGLVTVRRNWTTTPDTTTTYLICRIYRPATLLQAIQAAQRYQWQRGLTSLLVIGREIVLGSALPNNFDLFTTANVPDGLTLDTTSTFTSETTVTHGGRRGLRMVTDGTNTGFVRFAIPRWGRYEGKTLRARARVRASIASRVTLEVNDGVGTATTDTVAANNDWDWLTADRAIGAAATQVRVSIEVTAGAAVTVDLSYWYAPEAVSSHHEYDIDADRVLIDVGDLRVSGPVGEGGDQSYYFPLTLPESAFHVWEDTENTPRKLRLDIDGGYNGRVLEYKGLARHAELTGPTISFTGLPELILPRARYFLLRDNANTEAEFMGVRMALAEAEDAEKRLAVVPEYKSSYKRVVRLMSSA